MIMPRATLENFGLSSNNVKVQELLKSVNANREGSNPSQYIGKCPTHEDSKPSLSISTQNPDKILIHCHAGCSPYKVISHFKESNLWPSSSDPNGDSMRGGFESLSKHSPDDNSVSFVGTNRKGRLENNSANSNSVSSVSENSERNLKMAHKIIKESSQLSGHCIASLYLKNRGLNNSPDVDSILFHPNLHYDSNNSFPALIGKITDKTDKIIGIQRIYLTSNAQKAKVSTPKKILGSFGGGYIKIGTPKKILHLAEGIETGLGIYQTLGEAVYVAVSATNLSQIAIPHRISQLHIWADKDLSKAGENEAIKAAEMFSKKSIEVFVHVPQTDIKEGKKSVDWLDELNNKESTSINNSYKVCPPHPWEMPIPLAKKHKAAPFSDKIIPSPIFPWLKDISYRLQIPLEFVAIPAIISFATAIGRKIAIHPKKKITGQSIVIYGG